MAAVSKVQESISMRLWASAFTIGLSSLLFGYCLASLNPVIVQGPVGAIFRDIDLSLADQQTATAMSIIGAMLGGLFASYPNDQLGRRKSLLLNNAFFIAGGILCGISNLGALLAGRFLVGLGTGVESMIAPVLLSEIASPATRGAITSLHQLMITVGILLAGLIGYGYVQNVASGWKYVQWFIVLPAILQLALFWLVPESPRWFLRQHKRAEAKKVLSQLRGAENEDKVVAELAQLEADLEAILHLPNATWLETLSHTMPMRIGMLMMFFSAMTGINTVIFYSTTIFKMAGVQNAFLGTVLVGVLNVLMTMVSGYMVDKAGRKVLLTGGTWTMMISLILLGLILLLDNDSGAAVGIVCIFSVLLYVFGFALGLGAVQWVVVSEVVPTKIRSKAYSLFVTSNWTANLVISLTTLTIIQSLGTRYTPVGSSPEYQQKVGVAILYLIFACVCMLCLLFLYFDVPETQGHNADAKGKAHHDTERPSTPARSPRARSPRMMLQTRQSSAAQNLLDDAPTDSENAI